MKWGGFSRKVFLTALLLMTRSVTLVASELQKDSCDFYLRLEEERHCGRSNEFYLTQFGYFYCNRFLIAEKSWSADAQLMKWSTDVRQCLQQVIEKNPERAANCSALS